MFRSDTVRLSEHETFVVAHLKGEVDVANAGTIETELTEAVPNTAAGLIVDLSEVPFMDSSGLRLLFEVDERLRRHQQDLRIVLPKGSSLFRTLALVHLQDFVPVLEDVASAAAADGLPANSPSDGVDALLDSPIRHDVGQPRVSGSRSPVRARGDTFAQRPGIEDGADVNATGGPTVACPTCAGPMSPEASDWFCAVGHRFTDAELQVSQAEAVNRALWYSLRAIEDRAIANEAIAAGLEGDGRAAEADTLRAQGVEDLEVVKSLHRLIETLDPDEPRIDVEANLKSRTTGTHS